MHTVQLHWRPPTMEKKPGTVEREGEAGAAASVMAEGAVLRCFHIVGLSLLTITLPVSLFVSRERPSSQLLGPPSFLSATLPTAPYVLVPFICLSTLLRSATGHTLKPRLALAWVVVGVLDVAFAVQATAAAPVGCLATNASAVASMDTIRRIVAFVGVYEVMMFWSRFFVRQVVDHAVYGEATDASDTEGTSTEDVAIGTAFGVVWLTRLRGRAEICLDAAHLGCLWGCRTVIMVIGVMRILRAIF